MGEYATDKRTGERFKIGTCNSMYYVRYEQRNKFIYDYPMDNLFWRIPTPAEDSIAMGNYDYQLFDNKGPIPLNLLVDPYALDKEAIENMKTNEDVMQVLDKRMGLLFNLRCPHSLPLDGDEDVIKGRQGDVVLSYGYSGLQSTLYLAALKNTDTDLRVCVKCRCCGAMWSFSFPEIEPAIKSLWMKLRLLHQCSEYWYKRNTEPFKTSVKSIGYHHKTIVITAISQRSWRVFEGGELVCSGIWSKCRNKFISLLPREVEVEDSEYRNKEYEKLFDAAFWGDKLCERYLPEININVKRKDALCG